jgi:hypothetical protein
MVEDYHVMPRLERMEVGLLPQADQKGAMISHMYLAKPQTEQIAMISEH